MRNLQVLLVDDEEPALVGLDQGVHWDELNVEKLYKCHNKETAIRMLKTYHIDIVITDIEMPGGNGLELIRWVRENQKDVEAIFYTGFAEFAYAQEALRLGVADYLLKPLAYEQLEDVIRRISKGMEKKEKAADLTELIEEATSENSQELVEQVKKLVAENLSNCSLQRDELASMIHISPGYLSRIFKKSTGISLSDYITQRRIAVAKQLLRKSTMSITMVAQRVGFSYSSYFTRIFKEKEGITPLEYRQKCRREQG